MTGHSRPELVAVLYLRVSTEDQSQKGFSIPEQRRALMARAEQMARETGSPLRLHEFEDHVGGDFLERPALDRVREFVRSQRVDVLLALDPSRFSRKLVNQLLVTEELEKQGCRVDFIDHSYDGSPEGQAFLQVRGSFAELEKAKILERTQRGKRGKIAEGGIPQAFHLYGYTYIRQAPRGICPLVEDPLQSPWVRQVFRWCVDEQATCEEIARRLTAMGVPTPRGRRRQWNRTTVAEMLRNRAYVGQAQLNRVDARGLAALRQFPPAWRREKGFRLTPRHRPEQEWKTVAVPPLVDTATFQLAQQVLIRHRKVRRAAGARLLSGKGRCALCDAPIYYGSQGNGARTYLVCRNRYGPRQPGALPCSLPQKRATAVETAVWSQVCAWILHPDRLREAMSDLGELTAAGEVTGVEAELTLMEVHLAGQDRASERIGWLFARGLWPEARATQALTAINGTVVELERRRRQLQEQLRSLRRQHDGEALPPPDRLHHDLENLLGRLPQEERVRLVDELLDHYRLHPTGHMEPVRVDVFGRRE